MWQMNWLAVVGAALAGFVIGGLWYGPLLGKVWQRESGLSDEALKNGSMVQIFGLTFVLNLRRRAGLCCHLGWGELPVCAQIAQAVPDRWRLLDRGLYRDGRNFRRAGLS